MGLFYVFYVYVFAAIIIVLPTWLFIMAALDRLHDTRSRGRSKSLDAGSRAAFERPSSLSASR